MYNYFLHGMYYPEDDCFTHIDCTKNQYEMSEYIKKYSECEPDIPVDLHTKVAWKQYKGSSHLLYLSNTR